MTHDHAHDHPAPPESQDTDAESCDPFAAGISDASADRYQHVFRIDGLDCAEEVSVLRAEIGPLVGGAEHLSFDIMNARMMVANSANPVTTAAVREAVGRTGMSAVEWRPDQPEDTAREDRKRRIQVLFTATSGVLMAVGLGLDLWLGKGFGGAFGFGGSSAAAAGVPLAAKIVYGFAVAFGARYVVVKAFFAGRRLRPDMNLLMTIAVAGAVGIGAWFEAAAVAFLFSLSLALESWSVARARNAVARLLDLAPPTARVMDQAGAEREVAAAEVAVGAIIVIRPGERFPLDGIVVAGESQVDQAPITGESVPVLKTPESEVFAGTINGDGALEVRTTRPAGETVLARIIRQVGEAHSKRADAEQWVDRFAAIYTPLAVLMAIALALVPPLAFGASWPVWLYNALVLLVIACPCALVISTPVSIVASLAAAARNGVLVKGGMYLELPARLVAIAMDKTGTLTEGRPRVVALEPFGGHTEPELLARAAALERRSEHPLAKAIVAYAEQQGIEPETAEAVTAIPGKGVTGRFEGKSFWLGSHRMVAELGRETEETAARARTLEGEGRTVVLVGTDDHVCGLFVLADAVRPESAEALRELRRAGIEHLVMLTGDNKITAERIASETGIDEVHAELLPADKVARVEQLVEKYGVVAMVGDGVNDAPALARANLGIAMGAIGSDAAIETADIALMTDDLAKLPWLVRHSRRTMGVIHANIAFALVVKAAFVVFAVLGMASLWGAIAADVGASLLVVANGLRLLRAGSAANG